MGGEARANAELPIVENMGQTSTPPVSFADIMTVFRRAVREVKAGQTALEAGEARGGDTTYFNRTIVILLHLVCLLTKLIPHLEKEKVRMKGSTQRQRHNQEMMGDTHSAQGFYLTLYWSKCLKLLEIV